MIEFVDRVPAEGMSNLKTITYEDGYTENVTITAADNATELGTAINRANLMAIQGFEASTTVFQTNGSILETNAAGHTLLTTFNTDGSITEKFTGKKVITKTTKFNTNGSITVTIS
jgi:sulfur carrier protein ThiS